MRTLQDSHGRPLKSLRISVTDRCNLRCAYCMPEPTYQWLPREDVLSFEEIVRLARVFAQVGVRKLRLTGGEPLLRRGLADLVGKLKAPGLMDEVTITTNGVRLAELAASLHQAGLDRLTVSVDTLVRKRFLALTSRDALPQVLDGLQAAKDAGFCGTKINMVVMRDVNDDEIPAMLALGKEYQAQVRFIEYMDVGGATQWQASKVMTRAQILRQIEQHYGRAIPVGRGHDPAAPAERFRLLDATEFGIIASTSTPFCSRCDRARVTADGTFYLCLYAHKGIDLRSLLRSSSTDEELSEAIVQAWEQRSDRGAEQRLSVQQRGPSFDLVQLRRNPHLEMHTRGG